MLPKNKESSIRPEGGKWKGKFESTQSNVTPLRKNGSMERLKDTQERPKKRDARHFSPQVQGRKSETNWPFHSSGEACVCICACTLVCGSLTTLAEMCSTNRKLYFYHAPSHMEFYLCTRGYICADLCDKRFKGSTLLLAELIIQKYHHTKWRSSNRPPNTHTHTHKINQIKSMKTHYHFLFRRFVNVEKSEQHAWGRGPFGTRGSWRGQTSLWVKLGAGSTQLKDSTVLFSID